MALALQQQIHVEFDAKTGTQTLFRFRCRTPSILLNQRPFFVYSSSKNKRAIGVCNKDILALKPRKISCPCDDLAYYDSPFTKRIVYKFLGTVLHLDSKVVYNTDFDNFL